MEEALMVEQQHPRTKVEDYMVRSPIIVQPWQPVAYARQLMLMHSFSFLPVNLDGWKLVPEASMAKFLHRNGERKAVLARSIQEAARLDERPLELVNAQVVTPHDNVEVLLNAADVGKPTLWLVDDGHGGLAGVLSPFELM
ncbi:hypothetical protein BKK80_34965 (plasmid) [Cupriavidus malaysiensis]|uniref:CBS domain-containing protein n=1 Tax=Cupriavidus malaysiensis TaxID=367825 RepID=A0ABM6FGS5_9BURK|nr:hypothetical protein BKK80_34965 [Cupriavidus malaysiensis]